jgi:2,3-bisphosphoglycerate-independent phosphoglycerate mutase
MDTQKKKVILIILDGWGIAPDSDGNAVSRAETPNFIKYVKNYPVMNIYASGNEVGLLFGEMGNSEVGHLNIGAGRVYYQTCPRINKEIIDGSFYNNEAFLKAAEQVKKNKKKLHLIGLVSLGNVHSSNEHLFALLEFCRRNKLGKEVFAHAILDGRDCIYNSRKQFIEE